MKYKTTLYKGCLGDLTTEWWTEKDWENHKKYVEELIQTGEFGKPYEVELELEDNTIFDKPKDYSTILESCRLTFIDFNN